MCSSWNTVPPRRNSAPLISEREQVVNLLESPLQDLNKALGGRTYSRSRKFTEWAVKVADDYYPGIGRTAWAAPCFLIGKHQVTKYEPGTPQRQPRASATASGAAERGSSLPASDEEFVVSGALESSQRGDAAERILGRMFRILNSKLEEGGKATMFIISQYDYVHLLAWIRKPQMASKLFGNKFPEVFKKSSSYMDSNGLEDLCKDRGELDLMVLHPDKGILLFQIKSVSREVQTGGDGSGATNVPVSDSDILKKLKDAITQLVKDGRVLSKVMEQSQHWGADEECKVTQVIAVPGLSRAELDDLKVGKNFSQEILFLCREQMMEETADSIEHSEAESNIQGLQEWWDKLPNVSFSLECIKEIVGKYVGPLSAVVIPKKRNPCQIVLKFDQCVRQMALLSNRRLLTSTQRAIVESRTRGQRRVYISGPPGSGKTLLLVLRSLAFLEDSPDRQVIVVNMYPGASGRAIGESTVSCIRQHAKGNGVHHLPIDLHDQDFVQKVKDLPGIRTAGADAGTVPVPAAGLNSGSAPSAVDASSKTRSGQPYQRQQGSQPRTKGQRSRSTAPSNPPEPDPTASQAAGARPKTRRTTTVGDSAHKEIPECQTRKVDLKSALQNVLFIVDEMYVPTFWEVVWKAFEDDFAASEVWCAGLFSTKPDGFEEHELDIVLRCPPATQNLLYHVDWSQTRKHKYRRDTQWMEVPSNGPVPLCIRHESHGGSGSESAGSARPILDCALCARELANLLRRENIVRHATRVTSAPVQPTPKGSRSTPKRDDQPKVAILVNLPRTSYHKDDLDPFVASTVDSYQQYVEKVKRSEFIRTLLEQGIHLVVRGRLADMELVLPGAAGESSSVDGGVQVTWLYNFMGLEADVVIFLPGDPSPPAGERRQDAEREIPAPGLEAAGSSGQAAPKPGPSSSTSRRSARAKAPARRGPLLRGVEQGGQPQPAPTRRGAAAGGGVHSLSSLQWREQDIQRFSDWDKTNILVGGSRTLSLLILLVP